MSLYRYIAGAEEVRRILRTRRDRLAEKSSEWLARALEILEGELERRRREYEGYPAAVNAEVRDLIRDNAVILASLSRVTENKRNALLGWLYRYMRAGNPVERAFLRDRIEPLRRQGRTKEIIELLSRMHQWNRNPSERVSRYVHDVLLETRYTERWREYSRVMRETAEAIPTVTADNIREVLLRLIRLKDREERSIRGSINILARILPERYPVWAPRFHIYRRQIRDNVRRLKELLRRYESLERLIQLIEQKIKEIEDTFAQLTEKIETLSKSIDKLTQMMETFMLQPPKGDEWKGYV